MARKKNILILILIFLGTVRKYNILIFYFLCPLGLLLNFAPHTFPDPVAIDFKATEWDGSNFIKYYFQLALQIFNTEKEKTCNNC